MSDPFIGQIALFPYNFAPRGWAFCNGQLLSIAQNTALFSLLGTTFGGNGQTTFALPDLRGRAVMSSGQAPGLSPYVLGQQGGNETVTLVTAQVPAHTHTIMASQNDATASSPANTVPAGGGAYGTALNTSMNAGMVQVVGGSQPHENRPPYLVLNYCIALEGIFPSRN